jgi:hypothetical protein
MDSTKISIETGRSTSRLLRFGFSLLTHSSPENQARAGISGQDPLLFPNSSSYHKRAISSFNPLLQFPPLIPLLSLFV